MAVVQRRVVATDLRSLRRATSQNRRIARLEREVARLSALLPEPSVELVGERPTAMLLDEARAFFRARHGRTIYPDELARSLRISVGQAVEVCDILSNEGQIAEVD